SAQLSAPLVKGGKLKALAIAGPKRAQLLPDVPSTAEQGYAEFDALLFSSMLAPAGTPAPVVARMNGELVKALRSPEVSGKLIEIGGVPAPSSPEEFTQILKREGEKWGKIIRAKNIRAE